MAQQRLYTEEQLRGAIKSALDGFGIGQTEDTIDVIVSKIAPIELPTDEEIEERINTQYEKYYIFSEGAKWMRDQILNK